MSIVAVHGPNTFGVAGAGGGGTAGTVTNTGGTVTADISNARKFNFAGAGDRLAADYDWAFTGETSQLNTKTGTITFATAGAKVITLTLGTSGGTTPAGGTYTFNVVAGATAAPRSLPPEEDREEESSPEVDVGYDPAAHSVADVEEYAEEHPDSAQELLDAEVAGKNRPTLVAYLESLIPFDPGDYSIPDVLNYARANPDQLEDIIAAEEAGKARTTLLSQLEAVRQ